jgi:5-methylcytosine-specific restriction endonuclease McrA
MGTPYPKHKPLRLKGKRLIALYEAVYERDGGRCKCGRFIEPGTPPHHKIHKSQGGEDTMENLEMKCIYCHDEEHN